MYTCNYLSFLLLSLCTFSMIKVIKPEMKQFLQDLRKIATIGIVGGSDKAKQEEQMGGDGMILFIQNHNYNPDNYYLFLSFIALNWIGDSINYYILYSVWVLSYQVCVDREGDP